MFLYIRLLVAVSLIFVLAACSVHPLRKWEKNRAAKIYEKDVVSFNLSSSENSAGMTLTCQPPSQQLLVSQYVIELDDNDPIIVSKHSTVYLQIDPGVHRLTVGAKGFGLSSTHEFEVPPKGTIAFEYIGPYWAFTSGALKQIHSK